MARPGNRVSSAIVLSLAALAAGCASNKPADDLPENFDEPAPGDSPQIVCEAPKIEEDDSGLLDTTQVRIEQLVYGTSRWFDGLFGESDVECAGNVTRGFLGTGFRWDERDGTKVRVRFRAKIALPALSEKARLVVGRGDADRYIDGTDDKVVQALPDRFNDFGDQDFLLGLGFGRGGELRRGWDIGAGVKLRMPPDPYVRARYHLSPFVSDRWLWRLTPQLFWQETRGWGVSISSTLNYVVNEDWLLRSSTYTVEDEVSDGVEWTQLFSAYRNVSWRSAFSYSVYAQGETDAEVALQDYGLEIRYRRRILREWFFVEFLTSLSYPRESLIEERERNIGVGIEFEMQFGEWPNRR